MLGLLEANLRLKFRRWDMRLLLRGRGSILRLLSEKPWRRKDRLILRLYLLNYVRRRNKNHRHQCKKSQLRNQSRNQQNPQRNLLSNPSINHLSRYLFLHQPMALSQSWLKNPTIQPRKSKKPPKNSSKKKKSRSNAQET